jgi:hypothetical protein
LSTDESLSTDLTDATDIEKSSASSAQSADKNQTSATSAPLREIEAESISRRVAESAEKMQSAEYRRIVLKGRNLYNPQRKLGGRQPQQDIPAPTGRNKAETDCLATWIGSPRSMGYVAPLGLTGFLGGNSPRLTPGVIEISPPSGQTFVVLRATSVTTGVTSVTTGVLRGDFSHTKQPVPPA